MRREQLRGASGASPRPHRAAARGFEKKIKKKKRGIFEIFEILFSGRPGSDIIVIMIIWLQCQVKMGSLSKVVVPMSIHVLPLEASRDLKKPKMANLGRILISGTSQE